jgi:4-hydroxy-tetrahydrodipicolinate synthase
MKLEGVIAAIVTPFGMDGTLNELALRKICKFQLKKKINGIFILGSTGEGILLSKEERKLVVEIVIDELRNLIPVVVHVGNSNINDVFELAEHAAKIGANAISSIIPYFKLYNEREILEFYIELCRKLPQDYPVYVYNFPEAAGNDIAPELLMELKNKSRNIAGLKFSSSNMEQMQEYIKLKNCGLNILTGCDQLFYPMLCLGCDGLVSGNANILPELYLAIFNHFKSGNYNEAKELHHSGSEIAKLFNYGNIRDIKEAMKFVGLDGGYMRKPFLNLTTNESNILQNNFGIIHNKIKSLI